MDLSKTLRETKTRTWREFIWDIISARVDYFDRKCNWILKNEQKTTFLIEKIIYFELKNPHQTIEWTKLNLTNIFWGKYFLQILKCFSCYNGIQRVRILSQIPRLHTTLENHQSHEE